MRLQILYIGLVCSQINLFAQKSVSPSFFLGLNTGFIDESNHALKSFVNHKPSSGVPVAFGLEYKKDTFLLFTGIRNSKEVATFELREKSPSNPNIILFSRSIGLQFCPGIHLNRRAKLYLTNAVSFPYIINVGSSTSVDGTNAYVQASNVTSRHFYLNFGLILSLKPVKKKVPGITIGVETSSLNHVATLKLVNTTNHFGNQPKEIQYNLLFFFLMIRLS